MKKTLIAIIFLLVFVSAKAEGANWELVTSNEDYSISIDKGSIKRSLKNTVSALVKLQYQKPNANKVNFLLSYSEYDCNWKKYKIIQATTYYSDGTNRSETLNKIWENIVPDSFGDKVIKHICK